MNTDDVCEVIVTAPDAAWLADLTRELVEARLAACGHNIASIRSIYRWDGGVHDEGEARVGLHTRTRLVPKIVDHVNRTHPYQVPCVLAIPAVAGNPAYIQWILDSTEAEP
jgi:periplasmic divalent cation tolerance protein